MSTTTTERRFEHQGQGRAPERRDNVTTGTFRAFRTALLQLLTLTHP